MIIEHNQFGLRPGPYEHYKINADGSHPIYVVENIVTHVWKKGIWFKLQDPYVIYRNLENQYEEVNGTRQWVIKSFMRTLSEFMGEAVGADGKKVKRFKPI